MDIHLVSRYVNTLDLVVQILVGCGSAGGAVHPLPPIWGFSPRLLLPTCQSVLEQYKVHLMVILSESVAYKALWIKPLCNPFSAHS